MDDNQKIIITLVILAILYYLYVKTKDVSPVNISETPDTSDTSDTPDMPNIPDISNTLELSNVKVENFHRSYSKLTSMAGQPEEFESSMEFPTRRSSPIKGSRRYSNAGRTFPEFSGGFVSVI